MPQKSLGPPPGSQELPIGPPTGSRELPTDSNSLSAQASARHEQLTQPKEKFQSSKFTRFMQGAGLPSNLKEVQSMGNKPWYEVLLGPTVPMAQSAYNLVGEHMDQAGQAADAAQHGEWANYFRHSLGAAVPGFGPPLAEGDYAKAAGRVVSLATMAFPEATLGTVGRVASKIPGVRKMIPSGFGVTRQPGNAELGAMDRQLGPSSPYSSPSWLSDVSSELGNSMLERAPIEGLPAIPGATRPPIPAKGTPVPPPFNPGLAEPAPPPLAIPRGAQPAVGNPAAAAVSELKTRAELAPDTTYTGPPQDTTAVFGDALNQRLGQEVPGIKPHKVKAKGEQMELEGPPAAPGEKSLTPDLAKKGKVLEEFQTNEKTGRVTGRHREVVNVSNGTATVRTQDTSGIVTTDVYPIRDFSLENLGKPVSVGKPAPKGRSSPK